MKTLDQIEPRTPVAPGPAIPVPGPHLTITQAGSYFLTGNIIVSSGNAIFASASNVTIDLNGFTIGGVPNPASSCSGIRIFEANNVTVRNGTIADIAIRNPSLRHRHEQLWASIRETQSNLLLHIRNPLLQRLGRLAHQRIHLQQDRQQHLRSYPDSHRGQQWWHPRRELQSWHLLREI